MLEADCVMVDSTSTERRDDRRRPVAQTARDIGHLPSPGAGGMLDWLGGCPGHVRKILIHINDPTPSSTRLPERRTHPAASRWPRDGWRIDL